jgi:HlyD family secretion protein
VTRKLLCFPLLALVISTVAQAQAVSSLGRIEPHEGIIQIAGPSGAGGSGSVIKSLSVAEGDWVEKDQVIAMLDNYALRKTDVARLQAILDNARSEMNRQNNLSRTSATSKVKLDQARMALRISEADVAAAKARLEMSLVRSPLKAQVLEINTYPGERVGPDGILELAQTDRMYVVAEVYETDIARVKSGMKAVIKAPALSGPITGLVERISLKVGRLDLLGTDPVAKTDARVVEVYILLDDAEAVARFTNMQVEVEIQP